MNKSTIPAAQKSALSMLLDDHRSVKKLFKTFESEKDAEAKERIVREACQSLTVHAELEETLFYPFLRDAAPDVFGDLLDEALVEHASAKELIARLDGMTPDEDLFDARFTVLGEYVNHHIEEEENELFPKVIKKNVDLSELATQMEERRNELMAAV